MKNCRDELRPMKLQAHEIQLQLPLDLVLATIWARERFFTQGHWMRGLGSVQYYFLFETFKSIVKPLTYDYGVKLGWSLGLVRSRTEKVEKRWGLRNESSNLQSTTHHFSFTHFFPFERHNNYHHWIFRAGWSSNACKHHLWRKR